MHARRRGIPFNITYEQWVLWWGIDIFKRGRGDGKLQMCRKNDEGPYELGNIFKATNNENSAEKYLTGKSGRRPSTLDDGIEEEILFHKGKLSQRKIAEMYGTTQRTVGRIHNGTYRSKSS